MFLGLLAPATALAQSAFDGSWKMDVHSARVSGKPSVFMLKDGMWSCESCVPPFTVKADATDQPVTGDPYYDSVAIKVVDDHTVQQTYKKNGKLAGTITRTASADGKTLTVEFSNSSAPDSPPATGKITNTRVGAKPAQAHLVSGSWRASGYSNMSDIGTTMTLKVDGDMLTMTTYGQKYTAKLDGTDAPMTGDPGVTMVSVKKLSDKEIEESDKRGDKVVTVTKMVLSADGKAMTITLQDKEHGRTESYTANRQ
jgi:hypothetical protein